MYNNLHPLINKYGCPIYWNGFKELNKYCNLNENNIPQLADISIFLKQKTGFILRPTIGMLLPRYFLHELAFKIFFCTQYIRHYSVPFYSPEPFCKYIFLLFFFLYLIFFYCFFFFFTYLWCYSWSNGSLSNVCGRNICKFYTKNRFSINWCNRWTNSIFITLLFIFYWIWFM